MVFHQGLPGLSRPRLATVGYIASIVTFLSTTSLLGRSFRPRGTRVIFSTTSWPSTISPKMVCLPVSHVVGTTVMKNCEPFVDGITIDTFWMLFKMNEFHG